MVTKFVLVLLLRIVLCDNPNFCSPAGSGTGNSNNTSSNLPYISCIIGGSALILGLVIILTVVSVVLVIVLKQKCGKNIRRTLQHITVEYGKNAVQDMETNLTDENTPEQNCIDVGIQQEKPEDSENSKHDGVSKIHTEINQSGSNSPQSSPPPTPTDSQIPDTNPILVSDLSHCISEKHSNMNAGFKKEFKGLYTGVKKSTCFGRREECKALNRFKDITVYDDNYIVLRQLPINATCDNSFINAGYVDGYSVPKKYIATQGPLTSTVGDFWHMVWQEKVQFIIMLTNLVEQKKNKCARYWPEEVDSTCTYSHFSITNLKEESMLHYMIRTLQVQLNDVSDSMIVKHYQYITWPDYGVPESVSPFMTLNRRVAKSWSKDKGPIIVHCSAGVGRTGTFIAVDLALEQAEKEKKIDFAGIVIRLREQRMKMVQTDIQYAFIHDAVLESVVAGSTEIPVGLFKTKVMEWMQPVSETGSVPIETQYQLLSMVTPNQNEVLKQRAEKFPEKNRSMQFVPSEKWRVALRGEVPDYIHATFVHGYQMKKAFIIAQSPLQSTVRDFWKMMMIYKVSAIVMCFDEQENLMDVCFPYWNEDAPFYFYDLVVEVESVSKEVGFIQRNLKLTDNNETSITLAQFQFTNWPENGVTKDPRTILKVLDCVGKVQRRSAKKGPVVVHCSDTVSRSGMFCIVSNAVEQCKNERLVDVFQATKAVRMHKPGAVTSLEQYSCIHNIIVRYIEQNSSYSNFQGSFQ